MQTDSIPSINNKLGFHYFPDTDHYSASDLERCLPALQSLQASWLILRGESTRAIPEAFISGLVTAGIEPVIHLSLPLPDAPSVAELKAILHAYATWGVKYIILFDRPNSRETWGTSGWAQANLVESFLDKFLPLANECLSAGLNVIFPPLEPGGSYWDISFLHNCLLAMQRRNQKNLLNHLHLSAYARTYGHALDWGQGGQQAWPENKPYATPAGNQDQIGFNDHAWLEWTAAEVLGRSLPLFLLGLGQSDADPSHNVSTEEYKNIIAAAEALQANPEVVATSFWLLMTDENDPAQASAWIKADGSSASFVPQPKIRPHTVEKESPDSPEKQEVPSAPAGAFPIKHYLLLPSYEWGISDWHLDVIKPFVRKYRPTIGFSLAEAALASTVTVIGVEGDFSDEALTELRNKGSQVERISGDGTTIATQLAER